MLPTVTVIKAPLQALWSTVALSLRVSVPVPSGVAVALAGTFVAPSGAVAENHAGRHPTALVVTTGFAKVTCVLLAFGLAAVYVMPLGVPGATPGSTVTLIETGWVPDDAAADPLPEPVVLQ